MAVQASPPRVGRPPIFPRRPRRRWRRSPGLEPCRPSQRGDLAARQHAPSTRLEAAQAQRSESGSPETDDLVADSLEHPSQLAMATLVDDDANLGATRIAVTDRRSQHLDLSRRGDAVIELHTRAE